MSDLPTSIRAFPLDEYACRYLDPEALKPEAAYGGWDPADHFLSFPTLQIVAKQFGQSLESRHVSNSFESPGVHLAADIERVRRTMAKGLTAAGYVADQDGLDVVVEYTIRAKAKAWPAVPGVTVEDGPGRACEVPTSIYPREDRGRFWRQARAAMRESDGQS